MLALARTLPPTSLAALAGVVVASALAAGCGSDATSGARVSLDTIATATAIRGAPFTTSRGWSVTLSAATVSLGAIYYYEGAPLFAEAARGRWPWLERAAWLVTVPVARAHPGHYAEGDVRGQSLGGATVDLLSGPADLPRGEGVAGRYRSASVSLAPDTGGALGGHLAVVEGTATKDMLVRHFRVVVDGSDFSAEGGVVRVDGCSFEEAEVDGDGRVTLTIALETWVDPVDFTDLDEGAAEAPAIMAPSTTARRELLRAIRSASAYRFRFAPEGP